MGTKTKKARIAATDCIGMADISRGCAGAGDCDGGDGRVGLANAVNLKEGGQMEQVIDDKEFVDAQDLAEVLTEWVTSARHLSGIPRTTRVVCGDGTMFSRAVLIQRSLSDGSYVYDVRLS